MKSKLLTLVLVAVVLLVGATPAQAQANETNLSNVSDVSNVSDASNTSNGSETGADTDVDSVDRSRKSNIRVDDTVTLVDHQLDADANVYRLTFESDRPRQITVTESVQQPEGAGTFEIRVKRLEVGLTEVAIPVEPRGGEVAVSITTTASVRQGKGVYVSTGIADEDQGGPWSSTSSVAGWFGGISVGLTMMVGAAWQAKRRTHDSPEGYT